MLSLVHPYSSSARSLSVSWRALLFTILLSLVGSVASAAVLPLKIEDMIAVSDAVVAVRVKSVEAAPVSGRVQTTATFEVLESYKGKLKGEQQITYLGGKLGSLVMEVPNQPKLAKDQEAILFLSRPYDRMPKSAQEKLNASSPMVSGYSIVGGHLGKLTLVKADGAENKERKGSEPLPGDLRVVRTGAYGVAKGSEAGITLDDFRSAVADVVKSHETKLAQKGPQDTIVGIHGKFAVPEKSTSAVIRSFDPLPEMGYMSDEELKDLNKQVWEKHAKVLEEKEKSAAAETADDTNGDGSGN